MPSRPTHKIETLALALATGSTVKAWCEATGTPLRTAYGWTAAPEFRARVDELRRQLIAVTLAKMVDAGPGAVETLRELTKLGTAEPVRRSAASSLLKLMIEASRFFDHE